MGENDTLTLFELVGVIGVDIRDAVSKINTVNEKASDLTDTFSKEFGKINKSFDSLDLSAEAHIDIDQASSDIKQLEKETANLKNRLQDTLNVSGNLEIDSNTEEQIKQLKRLEGQLRRLRGKVEVGDVSERTGYQQQKERVVQTFETIQRNYVQAEPETVGKNFVNRLKNVDSETFERITQNVGTLISEISSKAEKVFEKIQGAAEKIYRVTQKISTTVEKVLVSVRNVETKVKQIKTYSTETINSTSESQTMLSNGYAQNAPPSNEIGAAEVIAAILAERALDGNSGGYNRYNRDTYDLDRSLARQEAYQQKMLRYAQKLTAQHVLPRVTQSINRGTMAMPYFNDSKNAMQMQATFGMIESGITSARSRLSQLGFGRTKTELKAIEGQLHMIANTRMDTLKDNIKLTEKALKDMKNAANAHEYTQEIEDATNALKNYKSELANLNVTLKAAEVGGFKAYRWGDKDVMVKEYGTLAQKIGGRMAETLTRSIGVAMNETYNRLDKAGIDIIGDQGTKMENKAKIMQLAGQFQTLGMAMQTVAPILGILAAGIAMVGKSADEAASNLQRTQLLSDEESSKYRESMQRTSVATNSDLKDVSEVYQELIGEGYAGRYSTPILERKAETGLNFENAMNVDAMEAIKAVDKIKKKLGVTEDDARNILALSLKEYNGDLKTAQKEVLAHKKHWKEIKDTQIDGVDAYTKMTKDSETLWEKMAKAARAWGAALDVVWTQLNEVLGPILDKLQEIGLAAAEWLSEHKTVAKWIGVITVLTASFAALSAVLLPVMSFLLMNRNVFQAIGQGLALMGKGTAVINPQAKMLLDSMTRLRNGLLGMPRLIGALGPAFIGALKGAPMMLGNMVGTFMKLNPLLTMFGIIAALVFKNIDEYRPALESIQESFGRIVKAIAKAFGGDATTTTSAFNSIIQKLADVAATVLVPAFELFAKVLEKVADWMENGGAETVIFIGKLWLLASVIGGILKGIGGLKGIFSVIISPLTKLIATLKLLKGLWPGKKIKAEVTTTNKTSGTAANTSRVNTQRVSANTVYVNGRVVNAQGGNIGRTTSTGGRGGTVVTTQSSGRNNPLRTPNGNRVPIPTVIPTPYVGRTPKAPRTTRYTHDEIPKEIRATEPQPRSTRTGPTIVTTRDTHDEIPDAIRTPKEKTKPKKPKPAASNDPHGEIPDEIRVGKGKGKTKGATSGIGAIIAGLVGSEIIEAILDLNTKKAEKNMEDFLKNTQEKIEELGGGGEEGSALKETIENLLSGDIGEIDPDSFSDIKEEITEQMQGIFGDDVFDKVKAKLPNKFTKFFGVVGKIIGRFAGFLTGPIGGLLLTILPLLWEFREPIIDGLKKLGEHLPEGLVKGIEAGLKWLKKIGKWFYNHIIKPVKKVFGIASPSKVMKQIGEWIIEGLVKGIKGALKLLSKVGSWIAKPFKKVPGLLKKVLSGIGKAFKKVFGGIWKVVSKGLGKAARVAIKLAKSIYKGATKGIKGISKFFGKIFRAVYHTIKKWFGSAARTAIKLAKSIWNGIKKWVGKIGSFVAKIFRGIYNTIKKWLKKAWDKAVEIWQAIWDFISDIVKKIWKAIKKYFKKSYEEVRDWLGKMWDKIVETWDYIWDYLVQKLKDIWNAIKKYFKKMYDTISEWMGKVWDVVVDTFKYLGDYLVQLAKDAYQWGSDVIAGIWEGMKSKAKDMLGWLFKLGDWIAEAFKKAMDIRSPSRVMYAIARWIPEGVAKGIEDYSPKAVHAAKQMAKNVTKGVKTDLTADDIMQNVVNSKRAKTTYSLSRAAKANTTPSSGTRTLGNTVIQKMEVHNHTERAARAFGQTMQSKTNQEVRRKMR